MTASDDIVVTGLGAVTPVGIGIDPTWTALVDGRNGFQEPELDGVRFRCGAFARVQACPKPAGGKLGEVDDVIRYSLIAAREAWTHAGLPASRDDRRRRGCVLGIGGGGETTHDRAMRDIYKMERERLHPMTLPNVMVSGSAGRVAIDLGLRGPNFTISSACASGSHAIAQAAQLIACGQADVMIAGGSEAPFALGAMRSWEALKVLSPSRCRPFADDRDGMTLGEGSAIMVLESARHAARRGAKVLAVLAGSAMTCDAMSMVAPDVSGMADTMRNAYDPKTDRDVPDLVIAHGTGTRLNDDLELEAMRSAFGTLPRFYSPKGQVGHMLGAAGAFNSVIAALSVHHGRHPATRLPADDPATKARPEDAPVRSALANAFAFGGLNVSLLFRSSNEQSI